MVTKIVWLFTGTQRPASEEEEKDLEQNQEEERRRRKHSVWEPI